MSYDFTERVMQEEREGNLPPLVAKTLLEFIPTYMEAAKINKVDLKQPADLIDGYIDLIVKEIKSPTTFDPFHKKITEPFDYHQFGIDFIKPIVKLDESHLFGKKNVDEIAEKTSNGSNVILMANHQTELDPQAIALMLESTHPKLAESLIYVAGHRVVTDPLATPFSLGCNLLCIYSKNYIEHPPELREEKVLHNQKTMRRMKKLLDEGGKCIYVAPSGGRDRKNEKGEIDVRPFNPQSIEMFSFISRHSKKETLFYPLALSTYNLLPPPKNIQNALGEERKMYSTPVHLSFGDAIKPIPARKEKREEAANHIWSTVRDLYQSNFKELL